MRVEQPVIEAEIPALDLNAYLKRIDHSGEIQRDARTLRSIHLAHATHIPFENLDVLLGRPIRLDLESIQKKIVGEHRGGYCFEQNALLAAVFEKIGFPVTRLSGRGPYYTTRVLPRMHMVLKVEAEGESWLADVGFGGLGLIEPIALREGVESEQGAWKLRLIKEGEWWVLQSFREGNWQDQYTFDLEPHLPIDYELGNYYCSSHPESRFVQTLIVQLAGVEVRKILKNREYLEICAGSQSSRVIERESELLQVLKDVFSLILPEKTKLGIHA